MDRRLIRRHLAEYRPPQKRHTPRPVHLVVDGTYFGERREGKSWCTLVARDPHAREDLAWLFDPSETTSAYSALREVMEAQGYTILSVTGDGFAGIKSAFHGLPFQMCHVHMERLVIRGTTRHPQTEAGCVLLALVKSLPHTNSHVFHVRMEHYKQRYATFLNEKTTHPLSGEVSWTHEELRRALQCLIRHEKYLFTYERNKQVFKTTNSLEGHFRHIKKLIHVHHGVSKEQAQHILHSIFLASSAAPNKERLDEAL